MKPAAARAQKLLSERGISGEQTYPVRPLSVPDPEQLTSTDSSYESVSLFLDRANAVLPNFALDDNRHAACSVPAAAPTHMLTQIQRRRTMP